VILEGVEICSEEALLESATGPKILALGFLLPAFCAIKTRPSQALNLRTLFSGAWDMEIFDYDNILLLPRKCRVESRSECDAGVELGGHKFRLPVVPANMKTVIDEKICVWMAQNNYFYVMHRFDLRRFKVRA
jgi:hypothetical protein